MFYFVHLGTHLELPSLFLILFNDEHKSMDLPPHHSIPSLALPRGWSLRLSPVPPNWELSEGPCSTLALPHL